MLGMLVILLDTPAQNSKIGHCMKNKKQVTYNSLFILKESGDHNAIKLNELITITNWSHVFLTCPVPWVHWVHYVNS